MITISTIIILIDIRWFGTLFETSLCNLIQLTIFRGWKITRENVLIEYDSNDYYERVVLKDYFFSFLFLFFSEKENLERTPKNIVFLLVRLEKKRATAVPNYLP